MKFLTNRGLPNIWNFHKINKNAMTKIEKQTKLNNKIFIFILTPKITTISQNDFYLGYDFYLLNTNLIIPAHTAIEIVLTLP